MEPKELDALHRACSERLASGRPLTARPREIGKLAQTRPRGTPVVIYGADWCDACHIAADYLARRGIPFVERDIETDPRARASMNALLAEARMPEEKSLPVIDVRGTVMYGFMPCVVEAAWTG